MEGSRLSQLKSASEEEKFGRKVGFLFMGTILSLAFIGQAISGCNHRTAVHGVKNLNEASVGETQDRESSILRAHSLDARPFSLGKRKRPE